MESNPRDFTARAGLGLSFLLKSYQEKLSEHERSQLLFKSSLHLSAALSLIQMKSHANLWNYALSQIKLQRPGIASDIFGEALTQKKSFMTLSNLGTALIHAGDSTKAIPYLREAVALYCDEYGLRDSQDSSRERQCSSLRSNLAVAYESGIDFCSSNGEACSALALNEYNEALILNPRNKIAKSNREKLLLTIDQNSSGVDSEKTFKNVSNSVSALPMKLQLAIETFEKAVEQSPTSSRLWIGLARARAMAGDSEGALNASAKAMNCATGKEEQDSASQLLEEYLDQALTIDMKEGNASIIESDSTEVTSLRLDLKHQRLKLESLQQTLQKLILKDEDTQSQPVQDVLNKMNREDDRLLQNIENVHEQKSPKKLLETIPDNSQINEIALDDAQSLGTSSSNSVSE